MSSDDRNQTMLGELLGELERTRRGRIVRRRTAAGVAAMLTIGAGVVIAMMSLPSPPVAAPTKPIAATPRASTIERITTDPTILDRVRVVSDGSRIERIQTRPMPELRISDEQLAALTEDTDEPMGVMRIGNDVRLVSARYVERDEEPATPL